MRWMASAVLLLGCGGGGDGTVACGEGSVDDGTGTCVPVEDERCLEGFAQTSGGDCIEAPGAGGGSLPGGSGTGGSGTGTGGTGTGTGGTGTGTGTGTGSPADCDYEGGWPCNPAKGSLADPGLDGPGLEGGMLPRFVGIDQHGDAVELWDFLGHGRPVLVQFTTGWAPPSVAMSEWLTGGDDLFGYGSALPDAIAEGRLEYVNLLQDSGGGPSAECPRHCADYASEFFGRNEVAVLGDGDFAMFDWLRLAYWPSFLIVESDGTLSWVEGQSGDGHEWVSELEDRL
ncbi:MAG: hypothetical protein ACI8PZ_000885 [Myxococcota bacterium]|jgi:hypothetical protein